ncbi:MAG TPA: ATP-binding protein [Rhodothermales bacterium]|nr:ATP-binding protein [Rhodothermales bacterium]
MNVDDLKRLVSFGEGPQIEFKQRVPRPERIAREVIALANTRGGKVLVGVDDDGGLVGVKDPDEEVFALRDALDQFCEPPVTLNVEGVRVSRRREVLVVDVPESAQKPHFLVEEPSGDGAGGPQDVRRTAFVRVGEQSIEASRETVRLMRAERNPVDTRFTFGEAEQLLLRYLERHERVTVAQYARLSGLKERDASHTLVLLTRARVLRHHPEPGEDFFTAA